MSRFMSSSSLALADGLKALPLGSKEHGTIPSDALPALPGLAGIPGSAGKAVLGIGVPLIFNNPGTAGAGGTAALAGIAGIAGLPCSIVVLNSAPVFAQC